MADRPRFSTPDNNDNGAGEFYNPQEPPYPVRRDYQDFVNHTNGLLSIQIIDSIHNLLTLAPSLHSENLLLAGEDVVWLRRMHEGILCDCFDPLSDQPAISKCTQCYGTQYKGGYYQPVILKMSYIPGRADIMIEQAGLTVSQKPRAWTQVTTPNIEEQDIIITYLNERYVVHSSERAEKQGRGVYQDLTLSRLDKTDIAYYIPVPGRGGETFTDFPCSIQIRQPYTDFPATIYIRNYYFYGPDGVTDSQGWDDGN